MLPAGIKRRRHHDRQLPGDFADQRFRYIDVSRHGLFYVLPVRIILSVENAVAVHADDVAPLEAVHPDAFVHNGLFFRHGHRRIRQLGYVSRVHGYVFIGREFLFNAFCRQYGSFAHHLVYRGDGAFVV